MSRRLTDSYGCRRSPLTLVERPVSQASRIFARQVRRAVGEAFSAGDY